MYLGFAQQKDLVASLFFFFLFPFLRDFDLLSGGLAHQLAASYETLKHVAAGDMDHAGGVALSQLGCPQ